MQMHNGALVRQQVNRDGATGGLKGTIASLVEHASPPWDGEKLFLKLF